MNEPVRDLLLCFGASPFELRPIPSGVDWGASRLAAQHHGLIPLANHFLSQTGETAPRDFKSLIRHDSLRVLAHKLRLTAGLRLVLGALHDTGIPIIVLKGPCLAETVYPDPTLRPFGDLDLVCHEEDWWALHQTLLGLGYTSVQQQDKLLPRVWDRKAYYHVQYFNPGEGIHVEVHFDVWQNGLRPKLGDQFWARSAEAAIAGIPVRQLSPEDQLLHLCVHLQQHSYSRLIWFTDIALVLRRFSKSLDWPYLVSSAQVEGAGGAVHYSLRFVQQLLGVAAPAEAIQALRPSPLRAWVHDLLWPPNRVLAQEIRERVDFHFEDIPATRELLLNMVITGRIFEKLIYLLRLIAPPSAWLSFYYGTNDRAILRRRRLVHAPKFLFAALRGIANTMSSCVTRRCVPANDKG